MSSHRRTTRELNHRIALIYNALDRAEPRRLLVRWRREGPSERALEAMRKAILRVDGSLNITTDALAAAFEAGLRSFTRRRSGSSLGNAR